jgi:transglutaminase-like putative cysteine protease
MRFTISCLLEYEVTSPVTFLLSIRARQCPGQQLSYENLQFPAGLDHLIQTCVATGTPFDRFHATQAGLYEIRYEATVDVFPDFISAGSLTDGGPAAFDALVLPYLYPSRYCQSDRLGRLAFDLFGNLQSAEDKVRAVVAWIGSRLSYVSGSTGTGTSAVDSLVERAGVCRDFAHLGIALCRAMSIPARYFTGYAFNINPPDFHACFETFIGGRWLFWDATGLASPDGIVRIGTGRDASDCSVCTSFGPLLLHRQELHCQIQDSPYQKMTPDQLKASCISLAPC